MPEAASPRFTAEPLMPELTPFHGLRYAAQEDLGRLVCPPYDVISADEQARLYDVHPNNAIRLELAKAGAGDRPYEDAAATAREWIDSGVLVADAQPSFYVYRQDFKGLDGSRRRVVGVLGALTLEDFGTDSGVLPHERTMAGPKEDRLALMRAVPMNVSPIYAIYRGRGELAPFLDSLENRPTHARFADDAGILHRLWVVSAPAETEALASAVAGGPLVIADGHHRYETALAFHREQARPDGGHAAILTHCVDADAEDLVVLPYNRLVAAGPDPNEIARRLRDELRATPVAGSAADALAASRADHPFVFVLPAERLLVEASDADVVAAVGDAHPAWRALDVVALHEAVLPRVFPRDRPELTFSRDPDVIEEAVRSGTAAAAVLLRAVEAAQVVEVARSGERMPQKASYFWPKLPTGLVFRSLR